MAVAISATGSLRALSELRNLFLHFSLVCPSFRDFCPCVHMQLLYVQPTSLLPFPSVHLHFQVSFLITTDRSNIWLSVPTDLCHTISAATGWRTNLLKACSNITEFHWDRNVWGSCWLFFVLPVLDYVVTIYFAKLSLLWRGQRVPLVEIAEMRRLWQQFNTSPDWIFCSPLSTCPTGRMFFWFLVFDLRKIYEFIGTFILIFQKQNPNAIQATHQYADKGTMLHENAMLKPPPVKPTGKEIPSGGPAKELMKPNEGEDHCKDADQQARLNDVQPMLLENGNSPADLSENMTAVFHEKADLSLSDDALGASHGDKSFQRTEARKLTLSTQQLFLALENLEQIDLHVAAQMIDETDRYDILQVEPTVDNAVVKKQYRKLVGEVLQVLLDTTSHTVGVLMVLAVVVRIRCFSSSPLSNIYGVFQPFLSCLVFNRYQSNMHISFA